MVALQNAFSENGFPNEELKMAEVEFQATPPVVKGSTQPVVETVPFRSALPHERFVLPPAVQRAAEDSREAFQQHRALKEAALNGTGLEQWQLLAILGDRIEDDVLREVTAEFDQLFEHYAAKLLRGV